MTDPVRQAIGPNVTLVTRLAASVGPLQVCFARLRADAGQAAGCSVPWGFVVLGPLAGVESVLYAVRTHYHRLGWELAWSAARILAQPLVTWGTFGVSYPGRWRLEPRECEGCLVLETPALFEERLLRRGLLTLDDLKG